MVHFQVLNFSDTDARPASGVKEQQREVKLQLAFSLVDVVGVDHDAATETD